MFGASAQKIAFYIGNYPVMKYGIIMGTAIAVSVFAMFKIKNRYYKDLDENKLSDLTCLIILAGIIGARLWYVLLNLDFYSSDVKEMIMINHGGISIQGAIAGGILAGLIYAKKNDLSFLKLADLFSVVLPLGQAVGRWGNFFNSEAFGSPCDLPWKMYVLPQFRPTEYIDYEFFHPTFLYESIANLIIFFILLILSGKKTENTHGIIFFTYLILYSVIRFFIEFIRIDSVLNIGTIPIAAIVSLIFLIVGLFGLLRILKIKKS